MAGKILALSIIVVIITPLLLLTASTASADTYDYYATLTVTNSGTQSYTGRVSFDIGAKALVDGHFIQPDAEDVATTVGAITAKDLSSGTSSWCIGQHPFAGGSSDYTIYFGNPSGTRNQVWHAAGSDTVYAPDSASLDIATNLGISCDVTVTQLPADGNDVIIQKTGNYTLSISGTPEFTLTVWQAGGGASSGTINPSSTVSSTLTLVGTASSQAAALTDDNDANYVRHPGGTTLSHTGYYTFDTSSLTEGAVISSVTLHHRAKKIDLTGNAWIRPQIELYGETSTGGEDALDTTWTNRSDAITRPGTGNWSIDDLNNASIGMRLRNNTTGWDNGASCARLYAVIGITSTPDGGHSVTIPCVLNTPYTLSGSYNGTTLGLTDGTNSDTTALAGNLYTNNDLVRLTEFAGAIDDLTITDNGIAVLQLAYNGDEISDDTIEDQSASNNDVSYTLAANPSAITATLGAIYPASETELSVVVIEDESVTVWDSTPGTPTNMYNQGTPSYGLFDDPVEDIATSAGITAPLVWSIVGTLAAVLIGLSLILSIGSLMFVAVIQSIIMFVLWQANIMTGWEAITYPFAAMMFVFAKRFY